MVARESLGILPARGANVTLCVFANVFAFGGENSRFGDVDTMIANAFQGFGCHEYVYALCDFAGVFDHIALDDVNGVVILHVKFFIVFNKDVGGFGVVACQYVNGAGE